jgi:hypothetical protein
MNHITKKTLPLLHFMNENAIHKISDIDSTYPSIVLMPGQGIRKG